MLRFTLFLLQATLVLSQLVLQEEFGDCIQLASHITWVESIIHFFSFQIDLYGLLHHQRKVLGQQYVQICKR